MGADHRLGSPAVHPIWQSGPRFDLGGPTLLRSPDHSGDWFGYGISLSSRCGDTPGNLERLSRLSNGSPRKASIAYARDVAAVGRRSVPSAAHASKRT